MRILLSCLQSLQRHAIPAYDFWRPYFVEGCREAGIECVEVPGVDWAEGLVHSPGPKLSAWRARTWETVLTFARSTNARDGLDLFLSYLYPNQVEPEAIAELQRLGIPCVNFFCDNVRDFRRIPTEYRSFALHWVPEFEALPLYRRAGLPYLHAPMPCWVPPNMRSVPVHETEPPTFIGSADNLRRDLLGRALREGGNFVVRGAGWQESSSALPKAQSLLRTMVNQRNTIRTHGFTALYRKLEKRLRPLTPPPIPVDRILSLPSREEYHRISREALVAIGVNRVPTAFAPEHRPLSYSRLRDLEAPMLGACYLTEWTAGLSELYELGTEIETYRTPEELVAKLEALKKDKVHRRTLRERGQKRALQTHCIPRSLDLIVRHVTGRRVT